MGNWIDRLASRYGSERNPYLRLSRTDRDEVGIRWFVWFIVAALIMAVWRWLS
jgi:hypothetical protein